MVKALGWKVKEIVSLGPALAMWSGWMTLSQSFSLTPGKRHWQLRRSCQEDGFSSISLIFFLGNCYVNLPLIFRRQGFCISYFFLPNMMRLEKGGGHSFDSPATLFLPAVIYIPAQVLKCITLTCVFYLLCALPLKP